MRQSHNKEMRVLLEQLMDYKSFSTFVSRDYRHFRTDLRIYI